MNELKLSTQELSKWFRDKGDYTHNITYDLTEDSVIIDLGGYTGVWANQMIEKYNPNVYILEPVTEFYEGMVTRFKDNHKVHISNVGVSTENRSGQIFMSSDGTSSNLSNGNSVDVKFKTIDNVLDMWGLNEVDLIQINIEGDEYPLLEYMLNNGSIKKFKNIQVQFHLGIDGDVDRRDLIRQGLLDNGFKNKFDYAFVWESWEKK